MESQTAELALLELFATLILSFCLREDTGPVLPLVENKRSESKSMVLHE